MLYTFQGITYNLVVFHAVYFNWFQFRSFVHTITSFHKQNETALV